jgi:hypothetical protein
MTDRLHDISKFFVVSKLAVTVLPFIMALPLNYDDIFRAILYDRFPRSWIRKREGKSDHHAHHTSLH